MSKDEAEIFNWPPLESDPTIFTKYFHSVGMSSEYEFVEVFSLDDEMLAFISDPLAVIAAIERKSKPVSETPLNSTSSSQHFYMKQTKPLDNACGVIAGIHAVLNAPSVSQSLKEDSILGSFKHLTKDQTPEQRATLLDKAKDFKESHRVYASQGQSNLATTQSEVQHHFVCFSMLNSNLVRELDGTRPEGIVIVEESKDGNLLQSVAKEMKTRLAKNLISERLSLMALVKKQN